MNNPVISHIAAGRKELALARLGRAGQPHAWSRFGTRAQSALSVACRVGKAGAVSAGIKSDRATHPVSELRPGAPTCPGRPVQTAARNRPGHSLQHPAKVPGQAGKTTDPATHSVSELDPGVSICPGSLGQTAARNRTGLSLQSSAKVPGQAGMTCPLGRPAS